MNETWFDDVMKLRPHFNNLIEKYINEVIKVRYDNINNDELQDDLVEVEDKIIGEVAELFGEYWKYVDMSFDCPWEEFEDAWRCGMLHNFEKEAANHFWYYILGGYVLCGQ